ncbi:hypothetical protein GGTG_06326 [Gaeumannomyces tritici R3-111a-1]|uniref:Uncharacterized protein n=1 Tax=Gaeumannomyces tritici (strain R3-111a-1) TaxID=644352 RepID=J3NYH4_GAET3|nr:hypothetical protein GGTG_06326 [Gaeumannomyces tritici R3-111a-1]EJT76407.1 hypothetical protein GGTG_06326 [Gaeumannomyces tritici R3-111a-1]
MEEAPPPLCMYVYNNTSATNRDRHLPNRYNTHTHHMRVRARTSAKHHAAEDKL